MKNRKQLYSTALASIVLVLLLNCVSSMASAKEITVNGNTKADFVSIQEAINSSSPGDTILVYSGIYNESVGIKIQNIKVFSKSGNPEDTVVQAFNVSANNITVRI